MYPIICTHHFDSSFRYKPIARYAKLRVAHTPGMPGNISPPRLQRKPLSSDTGMHHATCVTHVPWCMSGSLNRGGGGKHSRRMRKPQFYVSGKRLTTVPVQNIGEVYLYHTASGIHSSLYKLDWCVTEKWSDFGLSHNLHYQLLTVTEQISIF